MTPGHLLLLCVVRSWPTWLHELRQALQRREVAWREWLEHLRTMHGDKARERIQGWVREQEYQRERLTGHDWQKNEEFPVRAIGHRQRLGGSAQEESQAAGSATSVWEGHWTPRSETVRVANASLTVLEIRTRNGLEMTHRSREYLRSTYGHEILGRRGRNKYRESRGRELLSELHTHTRQIRMQSAA